MSACFSSISFTIYRLWVSLFIRRSRILAAAVCRRRPVRETLGAAHLHALVLLYSGWELAKREELTVSGDNEPSGSGSSYNGLMISC